MLTYHLLEISSDALVLEKLFRSEFWIEVPLDHLDGFSAGCGTFSDACFGGLVGMGASAVTADTVAGFVRRGWPLMLLKTD